MAITLITVPLDIVSVYNPIIVTCSSDNTAQPNFKYIFQVFIDSVEKAKVKISPRPNGYGLFNAQRIAENYFANDFSLGDATNALFCTNQCKDVEIRVGEEYGDPPVEYLNLDSCNATTITAAVKHSIASFGDETDYINLDLRTDMMMSELVTGGNKPFLTTSPREINLRIDDNYYLYALLNANNNPKKLRCLWYDEAGGLLGNNTKTLSLSADQGVARYGVGYKNIKAWNAANLIGASYYTVQLMNNSSVAISELFRFNITCSPSRFKEEFRLHWLNPYGGFDAFNFQKAYHRNFNIQRSNYQKMLGEMDDGTGEWSYTPQQSGKVNFVNVAQETIKINSNWITEEESKWLFTLLKSTQVFIELDSTTYAPVIIREQNYDVKTYASDNKLFNLELTIEIGNDINSQRG